MWVDLQAAVRAGVLIGVKVAVAAVLLLVAVSWFLGDYQWVRQAALKGQIAYERQEQVLQQQQQRRAPVAPKE